MTTLQKSDLLHAFRKRNTKRRDMVARYYQAWFDEPYTADVLAQKISDDLGIQVDRNLIYQIRCKQRQRHGRSGNPVHSIGHSIGATGKSLAIQIPDLEDASAQPSSLFTFL